MFEKQEWYAVPPYRKGDSWRILNQNGEQVALFERKEDCLLAVGLHTMVDDDYNNDDNDSL